MAQNVNIKKEQKARELLRERDKAPFMQVDKQGDPLTNFLSNLKRQFKKTEGLGLGKLFEGKPKETQKPLANPSDIIGSTKTVFRTDYNSSKEELPIRSNKKAVLRRDNSIKAKQDRYDQEAKAEIVVVPGQVILNPPNQKGLK